jgi:hypothetical protein
MLNNNPNNNSINQNNQIDNNLNKPWDPVDAFDYETVKKNCQKIEDQYEKLKKNPNRPKYWFYISLFLFSFFIYYAFKSGGRALSIWLIFFSFFSLLSSLWYYRSLGLDIIKHQISKQNGWFYDSEHDFFKKRINLLIQKFPSIFGRGHDPHLEDEIWGKIKSEGTDYDFYSGLFNYTIGGGKSERVIYTHFFIIKNINPINNSFLLMPKTIFSNKKLKSSSIEFNKAFSFRYNEKDIENEIMSYINPKVQTILLDILKRKGKYSVLFYDDCVVFLFDGFLIKKFKTFFIKSIEIRKEDKEKILNEIKFIIQNTNEIVHHLK